MATKNGKRDTRFHVSYMDKALTQQTQIIRDMRKALRGVKYDTIVVTGSSGMMIGPILARALRKKLFVVRKEAEYQSSHSGMRYLGELGERWIFVDDFCSSGQTFRRVRDAVRDVLESINDPSPTYHYDETKGKVVEVIDDRPPFETTLVGYVEYQASIERMWIPWNIDAVPGFNEMYTSDTPKALERKRELELREKIRAEAEAVRARAAADQRGQRAAEASTEFADWKVEVSLSTGLGPCGGPGKCIVCGDVERPAVPPTNVRPPMPTPALAPLPGGWRDVGYLTTEESNSNIVVRSI